MNDRIEFFPMLVNLQGRKCLVVGAGKVAAEKIAGLLRHGAEVEVISPHALPRVENQAKKGAIVWRRRAFSPRDVKGAFLAVAATNSPKINDAVFRACARQGVLCNAVDDPMHCDFFYPAVVRRGPLQIAISTGGCSPALASRLRRELEKQFGPAWSEWVKHVGKLRKDLLLQEGNIKGRKRRLQRMVSEQAFHAFLHKRNHRGTEPAQTRRPRSI